MERIHGLIVRALLSLWFVLFTLGLLFVAWLVDYVITDINLAVWVAERWFIPAAILGLSFAFAIADVFERKSRWRQLRSLSSVPADTRALSAGGPHAVGGVQLDDGMVGQRTVTCGRIGLTVWERGRPKAHFPWERIDTVRVYDMGRSGIRATVRLKRGLPLPPPVLSLPWTPEMTPFIPAMTMRSS